ncbi:MAG: hypothetical protein HN904_03990 [Victivallales bacterium]|nr:hypothetical protein [Victivallales bacterium]
MSIVRDQFWIWGQEANGHSFYALGGTSKMTAVEGAFYLGIPNCCRVVMADQPRPPFDQDSIAMDSLDHVVWSAVGSGGSKSNDDGWGDLDEVLRQARSHPNVIGAVLDDFLSERRRAIFPPERVREMRQRLRTEAGRPLDLWVVLYEHELDQPVQPFLDECDGITFWVWRSENLAKLEQYHSQVREMTPGKRHLMGVYLFDYGNDCPMPLDRLQRQCELGLKWLHEGTLDGMIFCSNCCADLGFDTVTWLRQWIAEVGDAPL